MIRRFLEWLLERFEDQGEEEIPDTLPEEDSDDPRADTLRVLLPHEDIPLTQILDVVELLTRMYGEPELNTPQAGEEYLVFMVGKSRLTVVRSLATGILSGILFQVYRDPNGPPCATLGPAGTVTGHDTQDWTELKGGPEWVKRRQRRRNQANRTRAHELATKNAKKSFLSLRKIACVALCPPPCLCYPPRVPTPTVESRTRTGPVSVLSSGEWIRNRSVTVTFTQDITCV